MNAKKKKKDDQEMPPWDDRNAIIMWPLFYGSHNKNGLWIMNMFETYVKTQLFSKEREDREENQMHIYSRKLQ